MQKTVMYPQGWAEAEDLAQSIMDDVNMDFAPHAIRGGQALIGFGCSAV